MFRVVRQQDEAELDRQLRPVPLRRQEAEQRVTRRGDRDGDGEDVVDQQRGAGDHAGTGPQQLAGDHVAAAAGGELLDDAAVGGRDQQHRDRHEGGERHGEVGVLAERLERLLGAVGGGRQPVGSQADPGEERDQRQPVEEPAVAQVARACRRAAGGAAARTGARVVMAQKYCRRRSTVLSAPAPAILMES